jgi:hypothetical protein
MARHGAGMAHRRSEAMVSRQSRKARDPALPQETLKLAGGKSLIFGLTSGRTGIGLNSYNVLPLRNGGSGINQRMERNRPMGDKGGKKNRDKIQKQKAIQQEHMAQQMQAKQHKSVVPGQ